MKDQKEKKAKVQSKNKLTKGTVKRVKCLQETQRFFKKYLTQHPKKTRKICLKTSMFKRTKKKSDTANTGSY